MNHGVIGCRAWIVPALPIVGNAEQAAMDVIDHLSRNGSTGYWLQPTNVTSTDWIADIERLVLDWGNATGIRIDVSWETHAVEGRGLYIIRADHAQWTHSM